MDRITVELLAPMLLAERHRAAARYRLERQAGGHQGRRLALAARTGSFLIAAGERLERLGGGAAPLSPTREPRLSPGGPHRA